MSQTVEIRFKGNRRGFYDWFDPSTPLRLNEPVLVEAERGTDFGRVNSIGDAALKKCGGCTSCEVSPADSNANPVIAEDGPVPDAIDLAGAESASEPEPLDRSSAQPLETDPPDRPPAQPPEVPAARPKVTRRAEQRDVTQHNELRRSEEETRRLVIDKVRGHDLQMRISDAEWQWDRNRLTIYFTAERRVDFRGLVRELAGHFRTRIELRQIGVRDEAARLGGVGRCGREYCCSTWLTAPGPVNLALAKDQRLSLNPAQISGGCGRLLCCLKYEHEFYLEARKRFPKEGKTLATRRGNEKVIAVDIFRERVFLRSEEHGNRIIPLVELQEELDGPPKEPAV